MTVFIFLSGGRNPVPDSSVLLAHAVKDPNGRAYNRTKLLDERRKMMQHWADYLDSLQVGNVVNVRFGGGN